MENEFELLVVVFWAIWHVKNNFLFESKKVDPLISLVKAKAVLESYKRIKSLSESHLHNSLVQKQQHQWIPPPQGWLKINVDATRNREKKSAGLRVIARDSTGKFVGAAVKTSQFHEDVTFAEVEAVE
ncbi:uncharacterized protein LOC107177677 [Citrus sinensis]|uniref:uncharacterized protein LOC107177677 n=1 Tax=Citrus sinensis TaxID=2711 RepID=UPI000763B9DB|nr:uncharacterized protein LOC107177677 [Citrus sinensis]